ncbi:hypothetical protein E2P64_00230 [Candidatus Bathyarchaeota archaeon]|nr:hypothetical protein E2P64_00230 [Candidatus Bathyarchaeota archaeon]
MTLSVHPETGVPFMATAVSAALIQQVLVTSTATVLAPTAWGWTPTAATGTLTARRPRDGPVPHISATLTPAPVKVVQPVSTIIARVLPSATNRDHRTGTRTAAPMTVTVFPEAAA